MSDLGALSGDIQAGLRSDFYAKVGGIQALEYRVTEGIVSPEDATNRAIRILEAEPGTVEDVIDEELRRPK